MRDLLRIYFAERAASVENVYHGELISPIRLLAFGTNAVLMPVADVRLSAAILSAVPVADNNHELLYALPGTPVDLRRSATGRLEIVGLSKRGTGDVQQYTMVVSTGVITSMTTIGWTLCPITLGGLASATSGGFDVTPLEALGLCFANGTLILLYGASGAVFPAATTSTVSAVSAPPVTPPPLASAVSAPPPAAPPPPVSSTPSAGVSGISSAASTTSMTSATVSGTTSALSGTSATTSTTTSATTSATTSSTSATVSTTPTTPPPGFTYFVGPDGNDANPAVTGATFRTIQRAVNVVVPGDSVFVKAGTYFERVNMITSGSASQRIVFVGETDSAGNPLVIIDGSDATTGWVLAPEVGTGVWKKSGLSYAPWMMTVDNDKGVWRIADKWMDGATADIFGGNGGYPVTNGKGVLAFGATLTVAPYGGSDLVGFWDGIEALFGYTGGIAYLRFRNGDNPVSRNVRVSPGPTTKNASAAGAAITIRNKSFITVRGFTIRGARNAVLIHGTASGSTTQAASNIIEQCVLLHGDRRVRFSGNAVNNIARNNYMEMRSVGIGTYLPALSPLGNIWPSRKHQRHIYNIDKFLVSGEGTEDDRDVGLHSDGTGAIPTGNSITGNTMYGGGMGMYTGEHTDTKVNSNIMHAHFAQHIYFEGNGTNFQIFDNTFTSPGQYQVRTNRMENAGTVYIYRNKLWIPQSTGEHFFLGVLGGTYSDSVMDLWIYHNDVAGGTAAFIHNFDTGFGPATLKIVNNVFSTNSVIFNGYPSKMGKYDYNWQYRDTVDQSWAGPNSINSTSQMWTPGSLPSFTLPTGSTALDAGLDLSVSFTLQATVFSARPGMVVGYGGPDNIPNMGVN